MQLPAATHSQRHTFIHTHHKRPCQGGTSVLRSYHPCDGFPHALHHRGSTALIEPAPPPPTHSSRNGPARGSGARLARFLLGDEGVGGSTDRWAGHQSQCNVPQSLREVQVGDRVQGSGERLHISLLGAWLSHPLVKNVATVQDEEERMDTARARQVFWASLRREE